MFFTIGGEMWLYFDYFLSPLFVGLIFKCNQRMYHWIFCCFYRNQNKEKKRIKEIERMEKIVYSNKPQHVHQNKTESV